MGVWILDLDTSTKVRAKKRFKSGTLFAVKRSTLRHIILVLTMTREWESFEAWKLSSATDLRIETPAKGTVRSQSVLKDMLADGRKSYGRETIILQKK